MRLSLKILLGSLLLVLIIAVGTEVAALYHAAPPLLTQPVQTVVVRKSATAPMPLKTVRPVMGHRPALFWLRKSRKHKSPTG